ncbi:hypothetical protein NLU13_4359 [Sarocladium strictum]|uniref:Mitochondrial genome maintenance protein MGM101 n=1 Tax=Sarocladium strictum TaxID=5046 RepID=A0AA39L8R3_SARSR|nr:hypothetical protein NLU13_4359 [Sarocladium strictum]
MFASRRAFSGVASRLASSPFGLSRVAAARTAGPRYSSEASATQETSKDKAEVPSSDSASANGDRSPSSETSPSQAPKTTPAAAIGPLPAPSSPSPRFNSRSNARPAAKSNQPQRPPQKPQPPTQRQASSPPSSEKAKVPPVAAAKSTASRLPVTFAKEDLPTAAERESSMDIDWTSSYHGISLRPVSEKQYQALMAPIAVSDIEVKPDGIIYLPEIKYRRRLNEAFGPMGWGLIPKGEAVVGQNIVTREYALIVGGRFVAQAQGENQYFSAEQLPSSVEGCKSNALMRCCKDLGIASELWDPNFIRQFRKNNMEAHWVEHATTNKKRQMWFRKGCVEVAYPYKLTK